MKIAFPTPAQISAKFDDAKTWVKEHPFKAALALIGAASVAPAVIFRKEISKAITAVSANIPSVSKAAVIAISNLPAAGKVLIQEQTSTTALETINTALTDFVSEPPNVNLDAPIAILNGAETAVEAATTTLFETVAPAVTVADAAPKA